MTIAIISSIHCEPTMPSSYGVDLRAEAELLVPHDLTALHERLEGAIRRRQLLGALLAAAGALGLAAGALALASSLSGQSDPPPPATAPGAPVTVAAPVIAAVPLFEVHAPAATPAIAPVPCHATLVRAKVSAAPPPPDPPGSAPRDADEDPAPPLEGSRLRAQLRIFDDGQRALVSGDPERALSRANHLRERYVNGPLDLEAAILVVRALRASGRTDDARAALGDVEAHPLAHEKRTVVDELRALLPAPIELEAPSRVIGMETSGAAPLPAPIDNTPTRVIGVVSP